MFPVRVHDSAPRSNPPQPATRRWRLAQLLWLWFALVACQPAEPPRDVAIVGLEATTYVNDSVTFTVAVVGGTYDSLELRRDGELFQVLGEPSFTWDVSGVAEGSYSFLARLRRGTSIVDSTAKVVVVDRTPPTISLTVSQDEPPLLAGTGQVAFAATAGDDVLLARLDLLDADAVVASDAAGSLDAVLTPERGVHRYRALAVDRAGNEALTQTTDVVAYVRETHTLVSEAALDGCISAGYEPQLFTRHFTAATCTWTTTWSILHLFSFDRSAFPGAQVEGAVLRFHRADASDPYAYLASVEYADADDAPPTAFIYPFVSTVPETLVELDTSPPTATLALDVTTLVQADVTAGRQRSQLRLRTLGLGPSALGGTGYFAEIGDDRVPTLELDMLVP